MDTGSKNVSLHIRLKLHELGILRMRQAQYACLAKCVAIMTLGSKEHCLGECMLASKKQMLKNQRVGSSTTSRYSGASSGKPSIWRA